MSRAATNRDWVDYGIGALQRLPARCAGRGWRRILLVCGRRSFEASGAAEVLPALEAASEVSRWSDFSPNTDSADLARGLRVIQAFRPDAILAVGGGSAMDMAKLLCAYEGLGDRAEDRLLQAIRSGDKIDGRQLGLYLVPTTSGSGSEATHFAVVYIGEEKFSIGGPALYADGVTLDPRLALSGSAYQRATSGIDAVCQAIESLWAKAATDVSRRRARRALGLLLRHVEPFVQQADETAARGMALGAHLAGRAIDTSKTTAAHALSYALTKRYGVSHGHAVALTLGHFIRAHAEADAESLQPGISAERHAAVMAHVTKALGADGPASAPHQFIALLQRLGLPARLRDIGLATVDQCNAVATSVNPQRLQNNPVLFNRSSLLTIVRTAL